MRNHKKEKKMKKKSDSSPNAIQFAPVSKATIERPFSVMNIVKSLKTMLHNKIEYEFLTDF